MQTKMMRLRRGQCWTKSGQTRTWCCSPKTATKEDFRSNATFAFESTAGSMLFSTWSIWRRPRCCDSIWKRTLIVQSWLNGRQTRSRSTWLREVPEHQELLVPCRVKVYPFLIAKAASCTKCSMPTSFGLRATPAGASTPPGRIRREILVTPTSMTSRPTVMPSGTSPVHNLLYRFLGSPAQCVPNAARSRTTEVYSAWLLASTWNMQQRVPWHKHAGMGMEFWSLRFDLWCQPFPQDMFQNFNIFNLDRVSSWC